MWNLIKGYKGTYPQNRNRVTDVENKLAVTTKAVCDTYTLLYIKQITNKDLLCSRGNSTQCSVMVYMGKQSKKSGYTYMDN